MWVVDEDQVAEVVDVIHICHSNCTNHIFNQPATIYLGIRYRPLISCSGEVPKTWEFG